MSAPIVLNIPARRAARVSDKQTVIKNLSDGVASLDAQVTSLPFCVVRLSHIESMERSLLALQSLLYDLRAFVAKDGAA